jgi:succinate-acetate transporter protein
MKLAPEPDEIDKGLNILLALGCLALYSLVYLISTLNFTGIHLFLFHLIVLLFPATSMVAIGQIIGNPPLSRTVSVLGYTLFVVSVLSIITDAIL